MQSKKINEAVISRIVKELTVAGESIRTRQDEKQSIMNDFKREMGIFRDGKISEKALDSSAKRVNKELQRIDGEIRQNIKNIHSLSNNFRTLGSRQHPKTIRVNVRGIVNGGKKKAVRRAAKRRPARRAKRKTVRRASRRRVKRSRK